MSLSSCELALGPEVLSSVLIPGEQQYGNETGDKTHATQYS